MKTMISSRKRKRHSFSNPLVGVFTRRKSQNYSHPNRSGRTRMDFSFHHHRPLKPPTPSRTKFFAQNLSDRMETDFPSIKDLRSRRVFSPSSVTSQCFLEEEEEGGQIDARFKIEGAGSEVCSDLDFVLPDSHPSHTREEIVRSFDGLENLKDGGGRLDGESDAPMIEKSDVDGCLVECNILADLHKVDFSGKTTTTEDDDINQVSERSERCNHVISPSARRRIFSDPSSFSYKRLLPFLMSMTNDRSKNGKIEKVKERVSLSPPVSFTKDVAINKHLVEGQEIPMRKNTKDPFFPSKSLNEPLGRCNGSTKIPPQLLATANFKTISAKIGGIKGNEEFKDGKLSPSAASLCQKIRNGKSITEKPPIEKPSEERELSTSSPESNVMPYRGNGNIDLFTNSHNIFKEAEKGCCLSIEEENIISERKPAFVFKDHVPFSDVNGGLIKGILKRNPRGCRGLCTCLNCSSFRLHAERSFEFSQNQMQDTEEITTTLVKELSNMQCILGKILSASIENTAPFDVNLVNSQIKEACSRASIAEEVIKERIEQMKDDLFAHYRIKQLQRPRVKFAFSEEKDAVQSADP